MIFNSRNHEMNQSILLLAWAERSSGKRCLVPSRLSLIGARCLFRSPLHTKSRTRHQAPRSLFPESSPTKRNGASEQGKNASDRVAIGFCFTSVLNANEQLLQFVKSQSGAFNRNGLLVSRPTMDNKNPFFSARADSLSYQSQPKKWEEIQRLIVRSLCR